MNGVVNGFSINSTALPAWVLRAVVVATAAATVASSEPTRTAYATAHGDAAVVVSLTQTKIIQARATGTAAVSSNSEPTLRFAGSSVATATASGIGAVRHEVWATAGGDATCSADALTAQSLGEAQASAAATGDLALAHIVHPGRAGTLATASSSAGSDVVRYATALLTHGYAGVAWGEASVKRNGNSHFEHDGYGRKTSTASSLVEQDKTQIIATLGAFDFGNTTAWADSFVGYSARATGAAGNMANPVAATYRYRQTATATATSTATADATRVVVPSAVGLSDSLTYGPKAHIKYTATGAGNAVANVAQALAVRTAMARQDGATAGAVLINGSMFGSQHNASAGGVTANSGAGEALQHFYAGAAANAVCVAAAPVPGAQHWTAVSDHGMASAGMPCGLLNHAGRSMGQAAAVLVQSPVGTQHWTTVSDVASATADCAQPMTIQQGQVVDTLATALVGRAYALANSEIRAPDERAMRVSPEDRSMKNFNEDRLMLAA